MDEAVRVDERLGVEERVAFFGPDAAPLFGCLHVPVAPPVATVVVCPSIWWKKLAPDRSNANAVTSQALTDLGRAATFYDCLVDVRKVSHPTP